MRNHPTRARKYCSHSVTVNHFTNINIKQQSISTNLRSHTKKSIHYGLDDKILSNIDIPNASQRGYEKVNQQVNKQQEALSFL